MRRLLGLLLIGVGSFLVVGAVLALVHLPGELLRLPSNIDTVTRLAGTAQQVGADGVQTYDVNVVNTTAVDPEASTEQDAVWITTSCMVAVDPEAPDCVEADDPDFRLLNASVSLFVTDRVTALGVSDSDLVTGDIEPTEGLVNKFPFETEAKTYPYWNGATGEAVDATYVGQDEIEGVEVYRFEVTVPETEVDLTEDLRGTYEGAATIFIEPLTGAVIKQAVHQERRTLDGDPVSIVDVEFTEDQVSGSAAEAASNVSRLNLVLTWVPRIGGALGLVAIIGGLLLVLSARRRARQAQAVHSG